MTKQTTHHKTHTKQTAASEHTPKATVSARGRVFEGVITKHFPKRVVIEIERTMFVPKYERFYKKKTRIHARIPDGMHVGVGDLIRVQECRPLSKIIHHIVIEKVKAAVVAHAHSQTKESKK